MAETPAFDVNRVVRTLPEIDEADKRVGATFVNVLFGLVVTQVAVAIAAEVVGALASGEANRSLDETRLAHLVVAAVLTVLSWIGYHHSAQYPPFLIKFVNVPLWLFGLDVAMVFVYYLVVAAAEGEGILDAATSASALPEAVLVAAAFGLYLLWDILGYRVFHDQRYVDELNRKRVDDEKPARERETTFGPRRTVTAVFFAAMVAFALVVWAWHPDAPGPIIVIDLILIVLLISYRLAKQAFSPNLLSRRSSPRDPEEEEEEESGDTEAASAG